MCATARRAAAQQCRRCQPTPHSPSLAHAGPRPTQNHATAGGPRASEIDHLLLPPPAAIAGHARPARRLRGRARLVHAAPPSPPLLLGGDAGACASRPRAAFGSGRSRRHAARLEANLRASGDCAMEVTRCADPASHHGSKRADPLLAAWRRVGSGDPRQRPTPPDGGVHPREPGSARPRGRTRTVAMVFTCGVVRRSAPTRACRHAVVIWLPSRGRGRKRMRVNEDVCRCTPRAAQPCS